MKLKIDNEFKNLIPPLTKEEYQQLEKNILTEGCRDSLMIWGDTLIDGHNRYEICQRHKLKYTTKEVEIETREEVIEWIIKNQFGRRNLSTYERSKLALRLESVFSKKAKEKELTRKTTFQKSEKSNIPKVNSTKELSNIAGVSIDTISKVKKIEQAASEEVKQKLRDDKISINEAYRKIRKQETKESRKPIELPKGVYDLIYADPPWKYDFAETGNREIENHYPTMELDEIKEVPVPSAKNSVLFLWATAPKLLEAIEVMEAWGFKYKTHAVWDKEIIGMGYWFRGQHELLLVGTKGNFSPPDTGYRISSVYREKRTKHSKKPMGFYKVLGKMFPNAQKMELFCREPQPGWAVWGNENVLQDA